MAAFNPSSALQTPPPTVGQLPVRLRDLLKREVCLDISRAHIEAALTQVERDAEELRKTRPPFLFLHAKPTRTEFESRQAGAAESQAALARGLQNVIAWQPKIRVWVEDDLETFLRDSQPAYILGLATHRYSQDWDRSIARFEQRVGGLRAALGQVQAALGTVPQGAVLAAHPASFEQLMLARQWGALLDYEFVFYNRVADTQRRTAELGSDTMKRLPEHQFGAQISQWARMDAEPVRRSLMELRARVELAAMDAKEAYVNEAKLTGTASSSYVAPMWEALRQLMRLEISPEEVEVVVADTERMLTGVGR